MILFYFVIVLTTKQLFFFIKLTNFDNCLVTINDKNNLTILKKYKLDLLQNNLLRNFENSQTSYQSFFGSI